MSSAPIDRALDALAEVALDAHGRARAAELTALLATEGDERLLHEPEVEGWYGPFRPVDVVVIVADDVGTATGIADDGEIERGITRLRLGAACRALGFDEPDWDPDTEVDVLDAGSSQQEVVEALLVSLDAQLRTVGARLLVVDVRTAEERHLVPVAAAQAERLDGLEGWGFTLRVAGSRSTGDTTSGAG